MSELQPAIDLLANNLGQLNLADGTTLNFVPFLDAEQSKTWNPQIADAIIRLLDYHGHIAHQSTAESVQDRYVHITCASCGKAHGQPGPLLTINTGRPISGRRVIEAMAQMDAACPHEKMTPDVMRQRMQDELDRMEAEDTTDV